MFSWNGCLRPSPNTQHFECNVLFREMPLECQHTKTSAALCFFWGHRYMTSSSMFTLVFSEDLRTGHHNVDIAPPLRQQPPLPIETLCCSKENLEEPVRQYCRGDLAARKERMFSRKRRVCCCYRVVHQSGDSPLPGRSCKLTTWSMASNQRD